MPKLYTLAIIASLGAGCSSCGSGRIIQDPSAIPGDRTTGQGDSAHPSGTSPAVSTESGIAPLGVFFDATVIGPLADDDFLNANISWQFGDTSAGRYPTTNNDRNLATGFVVGHVFETPGSFTVTATIVDKEGVQHQVGATTITVQAFSGTTRCLSTSGDFTGEPTGCERETSADIGANLNWVTAQANRRLLLRRGESWNLGQLTQVGGDGPSVIGAFGPAADPIPSIGGIGEDESLNFMTNGLRLADVEFTNGAVRFAGTDQVAARVRIHSSPTVGIGMGGELGFLVDSSIENNAYFSTYVDGSRCMVAGSTIDQIRVATNFSRPPADSKNIYIANNIIDASRNEPTTGIKFHSRRGVITDNVFVGGLWRIALSIDTGEQISPVDDGLGIVLIERNLFRLSFNGENAHNDSWTDAGVAFSTHHHVVIRNNLFHNMSRAFADTSVPPQLPAQHVSIYNNSIYKSKESGINHDEGDFLYLASAPIDLNVFNNVIEVRDVDVGWSAVIKMNGAGENELAGLLFNNNIYYRPGRINNLVWIEGATDPWKSLLEWQQAGFDGNSLFTDPEYLSVDPDSDALLKIDSGSPAVNSGRDTPASEDYLRSNRVVGGTADIGAYEYGG